MCASEGAASDDPLADQRVAAHERPLVLVELAGLVEDRVGNRSLADVVELGRQLDPFDLVLRKAEPLRGQPREPRDPAEMGLERRNFAR